MRKPENEQIPRDKESKTGEKNPQLPLIKGETAKEMMSKHINDKNHVITEDDFKNLDVEAELTTDTAHELLVIENEKDRPKDEDKDAAINTPWDLIK